MSDRIDIVDNANWEGVIPNRIRIIDQARVPRQRVSPNVPRAISMSMAFGLFLGVGLVFFLDYLEDQDEMLARDAYDEFAKSPYDDVKALKSDIDR